MENFHEKSLNLLKVIYSDDALRDAKDLFNLLTGKWEKYRHFKDVNLSEKDVMLITYGDSIISENDKPLRTLKKFLDNSCREEITNVHLLPIFPSTSDDGFSVSDYRKIDENLGDWEDIEELSKNYGLMLDAVINHSSKSHQWFKACLEGVKEYKDYYIESDPEADYSLVTRPRVLAEIVDIILFYASKGAKFIRLDAIGFAFKKLGTNCMHLEETHVIVKLMRLFLEYFFPGTYIITETNVPHEDNVSYFGNGDETHLVYQFPLPPLTMFSLQNGDTIKLTEWAKSLESTPLNKDNTYFNFLASHDGVGVRPIEGILSESEKERLFEIVIENGGRISYKTNTDGSVSPYELNISYMDGITNPLKDKSSLRYMVLSAYKHILSIRGKHSAFSPYAGQKILNLSSSLFAVERYNTVTGEKIIAIINVCDKVIELDEPIKGKDLLSAEQNGLTTKLEPYQIAWIVV